MSRIQIKHEIDALILFSGYPADKRMQCSLLRVMMMRHPHLNVHSVNHLISECLNKQ